MRSAASVALMLGSLCLAAGCGVFRHVSVEPVATTFQKPSNVAAYVAVTDGDEPLTELEVSNFRVYENDQLIAADQAQLRLLERDLAVAHHVLLLVDMSGAKTAEARSLAAKAALGFVQKLSPLESVSVFAFDGAESLVPVASVAKGSQAPSMAALEGFTPRDSSRNLHGAVVAALAKLDQALAQTGKQVKVGTLVFFSGGADAAGRVDADKAHDAVWNSSYDVIAIGVGVATESLEPLARRGTVRSQTESTLPIAFEEAADKARSELEKHYLVSYCSPARAGQRRLRLEVTYTNKEGEEHQGHFETDFDAKGFRPGCNPDAPPRFIPQLKADSATESDSGIPLVSESKGADGAKGSSEPSGKRKQKVHDSREHDQGEDAPVPPPEQGGYAK